MGFTHCMYPVRTLIGGLPLLNFPNVCTEEPVPSRAFCTRHCDVANEKRVPTELKAYIKYSSGEGMEK